MLSLQTVLARALRYLSPVQEFNWQEGCTAKLKNKYESLPKICWLDIRNGSTPKNQNTFFKCKNKTFSWKCSAMPYGRWLADSSRSISPLQTISLEQTLTPMRHHKPVLLGIVHSGSWQSAMQSAGSREDLEKKGTLHSDTTNHNCHKGFSHSKHFGLTGSLFWRQYLSYPSKVDIFCKVLLLKSQFSKEKQFHWGFSGQKDNVPTPKIVSGCPNV